MTTHTTRAAALPDTSAMGIRPLPKEAPVASMKTQPNALMVLTCAMIMPFVRILRTVTNALVLLVTKEMVKLVTTETNARMVRTCARTLPMRYA